METRMPYTGSDSTKTAEIASRAHSALDNTLDKAAPSVNRMVDKAHAAIDRVAQSAAPAAEAVQSAVTKTQQTSTRMMEACANSVRAQPMMAIGVAAAVGYLLGRMMR